MQDSICKSCKKPIRRKGHNAGVFCSYKCKGDWQHLSATERRPAARFAPEGVYIPLTQGLFTLIDLEDFERVSKYNWRGSKTCVSTYVPNSEGRSALLLHNLIINPPSGFQVDHINRDPFDNRRVNLRIATIQQNSFNRRYGKYRHGYKGISWLKSAQKFQSRITVNGKTKFLGNYETAVDAAKAYDIAARELHGNFALLNFPEDK